MEDIQEIPLSLQEKIDLLQTIFDSNINSIEYDKNTFAETYRASLKNSDTLTASRLLSGPVYGECICQYTTQDGYKTIISVASSSTIYQQLKTIEKKEG